MGQGSHVYNSQINDPIVCRKCGSNLLLAATVNGHPSGERTFWSCGVRECDRFGVLVIWAPTAAALSKLKEKM